MVFSSLDNDFNGSVSYDSPITGVVNDSSRQLASTYSRLSYLEDLHNQVDDNGFPMEPKTTSRYSIDSNGNIVDSENSANELVNDITRGESSNLESSDDYLERITGLIASGIYTAKEQNALNLAEAEKARQFNALEAEKARAYQLMLRDTQVQSTMKQLKEAGINPLLALSGSLGYANASSPAQASSSHTTFGNDNSIVSALILAVASALGSLGKLVPALLG